MRTMAPSTEKDRAVSHNTHVEHVDAVTVTHADGVVDKIDGNAIGGDVEQMPPGYYRSPQFIGTVVAVCFASICAYLGWVLPANTLLLINADIGPSTDINWVATVWTLGTSIGFLLVGRLSDIFGRKWMVMGTTGLGLIGNILGCRAMSVGMLIGANLCNGLAAAGQLSFGIVLGELVPNRMRGPIVTVVFLSSLPFAVFGPAIARAFILHTSAGWRCSYYMGVALSAVTLILYQFLYHPPTYTQLHVQGKSKMQQVKDLDFGGMFLFIAGTVLFLIGLSWGGTTYPWKSVQVLCTLIIGIVVLIVFVLYEAFIFKGQALMPPRLFRNTGYVAIVTCATVGAMVYYGMTVLWPTVIGTVYTTNIMAIGWQSSVVGGGILLGQALAGFAITYVPKVKYQTVIASLLSAAFVTSLCSISQSQHSAFIALGTLGCIAIGFVDNITFPGVTLVWEPQDIGLATGVLGSIRALGGAVAQALYVSVLTNKVSTNLPTAVSSAATSAGLSPSSLPALFAAIGAGSDITAVTGVTPDVAVAVGGAVTNTYILAFRTVFYVTIPFSVILICAACFVPNFEGLLGNNVAKRLQGMGGSGRKTDEVEKGSTGSDAV